MSNNPGFDFSVDREQKTITVKKEFAATLPLVWDAYTKSELLDQWWGPKPWKARTKTMDFREGGSWYYAMVGPNGEEQWCVANYTGIADQKKFSFKDAFTDAQGHVNKQMPQSTWEVSFTGKDAATLVQCLVSYSDLAQLESTLDMGFKEGMAIAMEGLADLLPSLRK